MFKLIELAEMAILAVFGCLEKYLFTLFCNVFFFRSYQMDVGNHIGVHFRVHFGNHIQMMQTVVQKATKTYVFNERIFDSPQITLNKMILKET